MKEITLRISDKKLSFFLELARQLGIEVVEDDPAIPQWQKEQVQLSKDEIESGTAELQEWNLLQKELFARYKTK